MIDLTLRGHIAVLTLRHGKANAMDGTFCRDLLARLDELRASPARAIVITGQGKIFSAGVDLLQALDGGPDYFRHFLPPLRRAFEEVFFYEKPIVAAVNGHAIAGGCVLTCAADRRLMAQGEARIGITELLVGVPFPVIALEIMRFAAAPQHFERIVYSGATFAPDAAVGLGLVDEAVPADALVDRALAAAETLAALGPEAFALTKRQTRQPVRERLAKDGPRFDPAVDEIWYAPETTARIRAYVTRTFKKM
ncbi:MAG TPA: enoyl-CoA hydratase/isomerase family protein [Xanthobacteraceae bacterium]|nr:enoyl-CoA hydratase/isomerase family protein [Xanthobacteraceae bacterium]